MPTKPRIEPMRTRLTPVRAILATLLGSGLGGTAGAASMIVLMMLPRLFEPGGATYGAGSILAGMVAMPVLTLFVSASGALMLLPFTAPLALVCGIALHFAGRAWRPLASALGWALAGAAIGAGASVLMPLVGWNAGAYRKIAFIAGAMAGGATGAVLFRWVLRWDTAEATD
jgi:hypothetical protein